MGVFWAYTLKVAICLLFFFVFNKLILSKDTFHRFNRVVWLLVIVLSMILPMFEWKGVDPAFVETEIYLEQEDPVTTVSAVPMQVSNIPTIVKYSLLLYFIGAAALFLRLAFSYISLFRLIFLKKNRVLDARGYLETLDKAKGALGFSKNVSLIVHEKEIAPFSWMNYIVVSKNDLDEDGREILIHELAHIKEKHSWDLLLADILILFQWFNPAAWLYKRSLQEVHEYRADESVIQAGVNAKQYQLLLIKKAVGQRFYSMANSFNHSKLKNRITMMLKEKSNKWALAKCLYALPLAFLAVSAFANAEVSNHFDDISDVEITQNFDEKKKKNPLLIVDGKPHTGSMDDLNPESIKSMTVLKDKAATAIYGERGENGVVLITLKDSDKKENDLKGLKGQIAGIELSDEMEKKPIILVNNEVYTGSMDDLNSNLIESITVLKNEESIKIYGAKAKNGVIMVLLKSAQESGEEPQEKKAISYASAEQKPQFQGGSQNEFSKWVGKNLEYPAESKKKKIQGRVFLRYTVGADGKVGDVKVIKGVDPLLDAEALRVVSSSPKWTPGKQKGKAVPVIFHFPVIFQLK